MARRKKVTSDQKEMIIKPKRPQKQVEPEKSDGPFAANLKLDMADAVTITQMQKTMGNKAVQRFVVQRLFGTEEEDQIGSKVGSTPSGMVGSDVGGTGMGGPGMGGDQAGIESKGLPSAESTQSEGSALESKVGSANSVESKVESEGGRQIDGHTLESDITADVEQVEQIEAHDRPTLSYGSQGPAVVALQRQLRSIAPATGGLTVDGFFGPNTREHVLQFQDYMGLKQDGIAGQNTWQALDYLSKGQDFNPEEQEKIREIRNEALLKYLAGDFQAAKEGFEEAYLDSALEGKPLQRAGVAYNIGLCVQQIAAGDESLQAEQREVMFKDAISLYLEAANTPGKAARIVDIQAASLDRIRECRAKEAPKGEPFGLEQLDRPEAAAEEEIEEQAAQ